MSPALPARRNVLLVSLLVGCAYSACAANFGPGGSLFEAPIKNADTLTVECWFQPAQSCPDGAYLFDKLIGDQQSAFRLEVGKGELDLVNTAGDITKAPLPAGGGKVHVLACVDRQTKQQTLIVNAAPPVTTRFSNAIAWSKEQGPLRVGGDLAGQHRFAGEIYRVSVYTRTPQGEVSAPFEVPVTLAQKLAWGEWARWDLAAAIRGTSVPSSGNGPALTLARAFLPDTTPAENNTTLWYGHPAWDWLQALPIGNGRIGGMVYGGIEREEIQLNEGTVWAGGPNDPINPASPDAIKKIRPLLLQGGGPQEKQASDLWKSSAMAIPLHQPSYQTLGDLSLAFDLPGGPVGEYRRTLDLDAAVARVRYTVAGVHYTRETFVSAPDRVLVCRVAADRPGSISFAAMLGSIQKSFTVTPEGQTLVLDGTSGDAEGGYGGRSNSLRGLRRRRRGAP
jgi:alpha-L-fucosidase 2